MALYVPDDKITTKIAAGVILDEDADPIIERWTGTDVTENQKVQQEIEKFFSKHGVKSVATTDRNMGCPHEEGEDGPWMAAPGRTLRLCAEGTQNGRFLIREIMRQKKRWRDVLGGFFRTSFFARNCVWRPSIGSGPEMRLVADLSVAGDPALTAILPVAAGQPVN